MESGEDKEGEGNGEDGTGGGELVDDAGVGEELVGDGDGEGEGEEQAEDGGEGPPDCGEDGEGLPEAEAIEGEQEQAKDGEDGDEREESGVEVAVEIEQEGELCGEDDVGECEVGESGAWGMVGRVHGALYGVGNGGRWGWRFTRRCRRRRSCGRGWGGIWG